MTTAFMACNASWLDQSQTLAQATMTTTGSMTAGNVSVGGIGQASNCVDYSGFYGHYYYPVYHTSPARPIKLTLSEVERLRKVAKVDDKLKAILQKFTNQIEIAVDFE